MRAPRGRGLWSSPGDPERPRHTGTGAGSMWLAVPGDENHACPLPVCRNEAPSRYETLSCGHLPTEGAQVADVGNRHLENRQTRPAIGTKEDLLPSEGTTRRIRHHLGKPALRDFLPRSMGEPRRSSAATLAALPSRIPVAIRSRQERGRPGKLVHRLLRQRPLQPFQAELPGHRLDGAPGRPRSSKVRPSSGLSVAVCERQGLAQHPRREVGGLSAERLRDRVPKAYTVDW